MTGLAVALGAAAWAISALPRLFEDAFRPPRMPVPRTPGDLDLVSEVISLPSPTGKRVHAWFIPADPGAPAVLVMHGWTGNSGLMLPLAPRLQALGFHALFVDARGHGLSDSEEYVGMPRFAEDIEAGIDWLRADERVSAIGLLGHSIGASAAILAAARRPEVEALVVVAGVADPRVLKWPGIPDALQKTMMRRWRNRSGYDLDRLVPVQRIKEVRAEILILHGQADRIVSVENAQALAAAAPQAELLVVPEAGHASLEGFEPAQPAVLDFLERTLR